MSDKTKLKFNPDSSVDFDPTYYFSPSVDGVYLINGNSKVTFKNGQPVNPPIPIPIDCIKSASRIDNNG